MAELIGDTKLPAAKISRKGALLLVFYDEEATGTDPYEAKIFQIAARSSRPKSTSFKGVYLFIIIIVGITVLLFYLILLYYIVVILLRVC